MTTPDRTPRVRPEYGIPVRRIADLFLLDLLRHLAAGLGIVLRDGHQHILPGDAAYFRLDLGREIPLQVPLKFLYGLLPLLGGRKVEGVFELRSEEGRDEAGGPRRWCSAFSASACQVLSFFFLCALCVWPAAAPAPPLLIYRQYIGNRKE